MPNYIITSSLGIAYMYAMQAIASSVFKILMLSHEGKIVKLYKFTYYDPKGSACPDHVLPTVYSTMGSLFTPLSLLSVGSGVFHEASLVGLLTPLPPTTLTLSFNLGLVHGLSVLSTQSIDIGVMCCLL